jgi:hypothetical protein
VITAPQRMLMIPTAKRTAIKRQQHERRSQRYTSTHDCRVGEDHRRHGRNHHP